MKPIRTFNVTPCLPPALERVRDIAYNLRWAWNHDTIELFRWDNDLWEASRNNPVRMLGTIEQATLNAAANDEGFMAHLNRVVNDFDGYLKSDSTWFRKAHGNVERPLIAYFSAEFGVTDCLSIFAGGLGILAGDHLKSASDLGLPLVGVGLLYQQGYFRQYLSEAGWQQEAYEDNDFYNLPLTVERRADGTPLVIEVPYPRRNVCAQIWRAQIGRIPLYLLDTNIPANHEKADQDITDQLYGGDNELRIKQEIMLGIGGYRALEALGFEPTVYHLNEGHSAFLALERIRREMETHRLSFAEAREAVSASLLFTTHTAVAAGHDYFAPELMSRYFTEYAASLGLEFRDFLSLGRVNPNDDNEQFCMTVLALRLARKSNGVSRLHSQVSRKMWQKIWPGVPENEVPIGTVSNGVHFQSWISQEMYELYDRYLGPRWREEPADQALWARIERISPEELWRTHEKRRERLVAFARRRIRTQLERRGAPQVEIEAADEMLDPDILTIGFGRRFATYKRATLLLRDPDRLARLLNDPARPVQIIYAGRAHPHDEAGKQLIQDVISLTRDDRFRRRLVFIEDHDMAAARSMVQGTDVWLNTPRRPFEASGTSGMKAAANGVLNLSTLDGWWAESWTGEFLRAKNSAINNSPSSSDQSSIRAFGRAFGWAIGRGEIYDDPAHQDEIEADALYDLLESDIVPLFYDRGHDKLPRRWIAQIKASIGNLCYFFNTHRMVREYTERFYLPAATHYDQLMADGAARAKALAAWRSRVIANWSEIRIMGVEADSTKDLHVGQPVKIGARVQLGQLTPEDISVEWYAGLVSARGEISEPQVKEMLHAGPDGAGCHRFEASASLERSGLHGCTVRVRPRHADLTTEFVPGMIVWAN
jgi:starch phosphorylase